MTTPTPSTPSSSPSDDLRTQAIARLHQKRAFWSAAGGALLGNLLMIVIWALSGRGYFWPAWTIAGAVLGLAPMGWHTFGPTSTGPSESQIDAEMARLRGRG